MSDKVEVEKASRKQWRKKQEKDEGRERKKFLLCHRFLPLFVTSFVHLHCGELVEGDRATTTLWLHWLKSDHCFISLHVLSHQITNMLHTMPGADTLTCVSTRSCTVKLIIFSVSDSEQLVHPKDPLFRTNHLQTGQHYCLESDIGGSAQRVRPPRTHHCPWRLNRQWMMIAPAEGHEAWTQLFTNWFIHLS